MPPEPSLLSLSLRLDLANECRWRDAQVIPLRPKTFAVLRYLVVADLQEKDYDGFRQDVLDLLLA